MKRLLFALTLAAGLGAGTAQAGLDIDFGAAVTLGDDDGLFLSVSARYFDADRPVIDRVARRYRNPDDVAVALYLAHCSGFSPDRVHRLRARGLSWWDVSVRLGLPADIWFVPVRRDPGPPYGNAYGHWKRHRHDRHHALVLTDADARNLVAVRVLHEYYGVSVAVAMDWRSSGRDLRTIVAAEYENRHGRHVARYHDRRDDDDHQGNQGGRKSKGKGHRKHDR